MRTDWSSENECTIFVEEIEKVPFTSETGTKIIISSLTSDWSTNDFDELVESLSRIMSPFQEVSDFAINLSVSSDDGKSRKIICIAPPAFIRHPVYCIRAEINSLGRAISFREAAAIQSFPDDYVFYGASDAIIGRQIGNAVPVLLAQAVGRALIQMEDHYRNHGNG